MVSLFANSTICQLVCLVADISGSAGLAPETGLGLALVYFACLSLGAIVSGDESSDQPLPRSPRKRKRAQEDTGLPADEELEKLARVYLETATQLWPELHKSGVLPTPTDALITTMVGDFKDRHRSGIVEPQVLDRYLAQQLQLAADYPRYSSDNSDPKSVPDQLRLALRRAKQDERFIPWELIVADYGRSATHGFRQGFENLLRMIKNKDLRFDVVYIDDFHRGSRNEPEWWKLASLCKKLKVRMIGVSDGFHIDDDDWDSKVGFYNLITQMENKYKRQRVRRGMGGAAQENRTLGLLPLGFARRVKRDANGNIEHKPNGLSKTERCIDPQSKETALLMWDLFYKKKWSPYKITQKFNRERVEGWDGWTQSGIRRLLVNPAYIGLFIWNRTRREYNWETHKSEKLPNPWTEWEWCYVPELALIPKAWHVYARTRLIKSRKPRAKPQRCPVTLFSGTLICGYCGSELKLMRSAGKNKSMGCANGQQRANNCQLHCSKSVRLLEERLLNTVWSNLLTEDVLEGLVTKANEQLAIEHLRPKPDAEPLRRQEQARSREIKKLMERVRKTEDEALCQAYDVEIAALQRRLNDIRRELAEMGRAHGMLPPPLDISRIEIYLADLRTLFNQEIPLANELIRKFTGPIRITQERYKDRPTGAEWFAEFAPNFFCLLTTLAKSFDYPDSDTLEILCSRNWIPAEPVRVSIGFNPLYAQFAPEFKRLRDDGSTILAIAGAYGRSIDFVRHVIDFAQQGARGYYPKKSTAGKRKPTASQAKKDQAVPKHVQLRELVGELRDGHNLNFSQIAKVLKDKHKIQASLPTIKIAYFGGRPELVRGIEVDDIATEP